MPTRHAPLAAYAAPVVRTQETACSSDSRFRRKLSGTTDVVFWERRDRRWCVWQHRSGYIYPQSLWVYMCAYTSIRIYIKVGLTVSRAAIWRQSLTVFFCSFGNTYIYRSIYMYICMYLHISTRFYIKDSPFPARLFGAKLHCSSTVLATYTIYIYIYIYIYICVCVCVCVCVCARARARVCVCMCVYVAQYMYTVLCKGLAVSRAVIWRESSTVTFCNLENIYNIYIYIYIYI